MLRYVSKTEIILYKYEFQEILYADKYIINIKNKNN